MRIKLPTIGKVERTYKLSLFIANLKAEADKLTSKASALRSEAARLQLEMDKA